VQSLTESPAFLQIIRASALKELTGLSGTTLWRCERDDPDFPKRIVMSRGAVGWRARDIEAWLVKRQEEPLKRAHPPVSPGRPKAERKPKSQRG